MNASLANSLICLECREPLQLDKLSSPAGQIETGTLTCSGCARSYPIRRGVPRFTTDSEADTSFGFQWNKFRTEQLDSENGARLSAQRFERETEWSPESLKGARVLDVGCGAGRFLEVSSALDCHVVGVDLSSAVDAAALTVGGRQNADVVQADVYRLPFREGAFDAVYCIGVAQHTPSPERTLTSLARMVRPGGRVAVTVYERRPWTLLNGKYLLRPLTKRLGRRSLLLGLRMSMPVLFPLTEVLFRIPKAGRLFDFLIPVANYVNVRDLSWRQRYDWALMDTFDRLAPEFDRPLTEAEVRAALAAAGIEQMVRLPNPGVNIVGVRSGAPA